MLDFGDADLLLWAHCLTSVGRFST